MSLIPLDIDTIVESKPAPIGKYSLVVESCEETKSKKGKPMFDMSITIEGQPDAPNVRHFASLPAEGDTPDASRYKSLLLRRLCHMFKVPLKGGMDTAALAQSLVGARATGELSLDKETDADGNEKSDGRTYNRLVIPNLPDEGQGKQGVPPPPKR